MGFLLHSRFLIDIVIIGFLITSIVLFFFIYIQSFKIKTKVLKKSKLFFISIFKLKNLLRYRRIKTPKLTKPNLILAFFVLFVWFNRNLILSNIKVSLRLSLFLYLFSFVEFNSLLSLQFRQTKL